MNVIDTVEVDVLKMPCECSPSTCPYKDKQCSRWYLGAQDVQKIRKLCNVPASDCVVKQRARHVGGIHRLVGNPDSSNSGPLIHYTALE